MCVIDLLCACDVGACYIACTCVSIHTRVRVWVCVCVHVAATTEQLQRVQVLYVCMGSIVCVCVYI